MAYPATILADVAQDLLDNGVASLTAAGRTIPDRLMVTHGQPVGEMLEDCVETLAAWVSAIGIPPRPPGTNHAGCSTKSVVSLNLTLYRCVPTMQEDGSPFEPAVYDASGKALATDGWVLWFGILAAWGDGSLFEDLGLACSAFDVSGGTISLPPTGGLAGWNLTGRLTL